MIKDAIKFISLGILAVSGVLGAIVAIGSITIWFLPFRTEASFFDLFLAGLLGSVVLVFTLMILDLLYHTGMWLNEVIEIKKREFRNGKL